MPQQDRTLYVGNLPYECTEEELDALMKAAGVEGVERVNLPMGADGRRRGFGFVNMVSGEAATAAVDKLRDTEMNGRRLIINVAHPKGERPARPDRFDGPPPRAGGGGMGMGGGGGPRNHSGPPPDPGDPALMMPPPSHDMPRRMHEDRKRTRPEAERANTKGGGRPRRKERRRSGRRRGGYADEFDDE